MVTDFAFGREMLKNGIKNDVFGPSHGALKAFVFNKNILRAIPPENNIFFYLKNCRFYTFSGIHDNCPPLRKSTNFQTDGGELSCKFGYVQKYI